MALTTIDLQGYLRRRLDGDPSVPVQTLRDQAGEYLVSMHAWNWLARPAAKLSLIADRSWVKLPADWGRARGRPRASSTQSLLTFEWGSFNQVLELRSSVTTSSGPNYIGAVIYADDGDEGYGPRAEVWPTPSTTTTNAFSAPYLAGWFAPEDDGEKLRIPTWMEAFYLEVLFAFAQGYDEHDMGSRAKRLAELESGPEVVRLKQRDGGVQPFIGAMTGGAMAGEMYGDRAAIGIGVRVQGPS